MNTVRIIDLETTGLDPETDRIVEFAHVDWTDGVISEPFSMLINPERDIPALAKAVHHITEADVANSWKIEDLLRDYVGPDICAAHMADFDRKFLPADFAKYWVCTYKVALRIWPDLPSHSNQFLRYHLGLPDPTSGQPHRAAYDAFVTAHLFAEEIKHLTVKEMVAISREPGLLKMVNFGKYFGKGKTFAEIATTDEKYLRWVAEESTLSEDIKFSARLALKAWTTSQDDLP
jgi:exodeoxyribonuclease X